jgi:aminoglycoside phosphotransferase (APT) family kinase protein
VIPGAPSEARWVRISPRRELPTALLEQIVRIAFPRNRVLAAEPLGDGLRNSNFKLHLDSMREAIVLRIYEHDPSLCRKELDLLGLVSSSVPVPEVLHAEPLALDGLPPFALLRYVEGITFRELGRNGDGDAIAQAAYSAGATLAAIGRFTFGKAGWLGPGPAVTAPLLQGPDPVPRFVDLCLASPYLRTRMPPELRDATHNLVWACRPQLSSLESESRLVHGDFGKRNIVVRSVAGRWSVAAVIDWEFAVSSSPLADVAHFLRYERASRPRAEPHFTIGFSDAGGELPEDWRRLGKVLDLVALCEALTRDELPEPAVVELVELVRATVENRELELAL